MSTETETKNPNLNTMKDPYPVRFFADDWTTAHSLRDKLCGVPNITQVIRVACSLGLKQMVHMDMAELLGCFKGVK